MSTTVTIRTATLGDIPTMAELIAELNFAEGNHVSIADTSLAYTIFGGDARIPMRAMVAEKDNNVIGLTLYYWGFDTISASYGYHLADIVVTKTEQRQHIGRKLFVAMGAQCLAENGQWISLTVLKINESAQKFYESLGMTKVKVDFFAIGPQALKKLC